MRRQDLKYLVAYVAPLAGFAGIYLQGIWSFGSMYVAFVLIPLLEPLLPKSVRNFSPEQERDRLGARFFDFLLYLNLPILYALLAYYFHTLANTTLATYEVVGLTLNVGLVVGTIGINVGHELGHRAKTYEQRMAKVLLLPALYTHFYIEHNRGHHRHVATPHDPATSRKGETLYAFWWRSVTQSYIHAWQLEAERLDKKNLPFWSIHNEMIRFQLAQAAYLLAVGLLWGWMMVPFAAAVAVVGFLMLETVNYIEHYGLLRKRLPTGRYEKVQPWHSWNSDHELGRIFLYELTRHSDHHYKASRKYQILRHFDESPQLPVGYPASMLMSLLPPLWFAVMNPRVENVKKAQPEFLRQA